MEYNEFLIAVTERVSELLPEETAVSTSHCTINNGVETDCLYIRRENENVFPSIHLDSLYEAYETGMPMETVCSIIIKQYNNALSQSVSPDCLDMSQEEFESRVCFRIIDHAKNEELLQRLPHFDLLGFAVIFTLELGAIGDCSYCTKINHQLACTYGESPERLFALAARNTPALLPAKLERLEDVIAPMCNVPPLPEDFDSHLFVLTNRRLSHGASAIMYPGVLDDIREIYGDDFYILPSSIHEVILAQAEYTKGNTPDFLDGLIQKVNSIAVDPCEYLGSRAVTYSEFKRKFARLLLEINTALLHENAGPGLAMYGFSSYGSPVAREMDISFSNF